jgi:hypothetical protein
VVLAVLSALLSCGACSAASAPDVARPSIVTPPPTVVASARARDRIPRAVPEPDARNQFAPQLDVEISVSRNGFVEARTAPGASCSASLVRSSALSGLSEVVMPLRVADQTGTVSWTYDAVGGGSGLHTVRCNRGGQQIVATAGFTVP